MRLRAAWSVLGASVLVLACTHDFDTFELHGGASVKDSGTGASRADAAMSGNGGASEAGAGDASRGGTSGFTGGGGAGASDDARAPIDGAMGGAPDGAPPNDGSVTPDSGRTEGGSAGAGGSDAGAGGTDSGAGAGGAAAGGSSGCLATEKLCGVQCVPRDSPATGCDGVSCATCAVANASTDKCVAGACAPEVCLSGFGDCNGTAADGCEHDVTNDALACGACARNCAGDHVEGRVCAASVCASSCDPGRANCNRPATGPDDGCEIDATVDSANCGGCGNDCSMQNGKSCIGGLCGCTADAQCVSGPPQGTITCDTTGNVCHCDANVCGHGESCRAGACSCNGGNACAATSTCCRAPMGCRNLMTDAQSCGACGHACSPGFVCQAGACRCNGDNDCRGGTCVAGMCHCGATTCAEGERCLSNGSCG